MIDFPIDELLDDEACTEWLEKHLHPDGFRCPHCASPIHHLETARQQGEHYAWSSISRIFAIGALGVNGFPEDSATNAPWVKSIRGSCPISVWVRTCVFEMLPIRAAGYDAEMIIMRRLKCGRSAAQAECQLGFLATTHTDWA